MDLPPGRTVQRTLSLTLGAVHTGSVATPEPARRQAVEAADRAVFVAEIVGARDKKKLPEVW